MSYQKHNFEAGAVLFASQLNDMDNQIEILSNQESTLSENFKVALLNCFENVAWINQNGQSYYNELYNALYPDIFWTVTNTLSNCTNSNNTTNVLKNSSYVATIIANEGYTLDGATVNISMGGNDVTNLYYSSGSINIPNVTGNLVITVLASSAVTSISAVFTQGSAVIYDIDSLDTLRQYLVVTATYSNSETAVVTDYTLSGTLTAGTSTITVNYGGKTDTFTVTVTGVVWLYKDGEEYITLTGGWDIGSGFVVNDSKITASKSDNIFSFTLLQEATGSAGAAAQSISTHNPIDLTNYSEMLIDYEATVNPLTGTNNTWMYFPTSLATSNTQAGAYGSDYSTERARVNLYNGSSDYSGVRRTRSINIEDYGLVYLSLNFNVYAGANEGTYTKIHSVYLK